MVHFLRLPRRRCLLERSPQAAAKGVSQERRACGLDGGVSASFEVEGEHGEEKRFEAGCGGRGGCR